MPDDTLLDPMLLRAVKGRLGQRTNTMGAGALDKLSILRSLQLNNPAAMGGGGMSGGGKGNFNPAKPGAGFMPPKPPDNIAQGEFGPGEFQSLVQPDLRKPLGGGNIDPTKADRTPYMGVNDPKNILASRLERMKQGQGSPQNYDSALAWQRANRENTLLPEPEFKSPATVSPLAPNISPRSPLSTKQIYSAAKALEAKGLKEDASLVRKYNFSSEQFRDAIKDYRLAEVDKGAWVKKNAVKDTDAGLEDMERLNKFLAFSKEPPMNFMQYRELKEFELRNKIRNQGDEAFYGELKSNLTSMHSELDRIHKLIQDHQE